LYLQVSKTLTRSWVFRFQMNKKIRDMGLGSVNTLTLKEAREKAREYRKMLLDGIDPIDERRDSKMARHQAALLETASRMTFADCSNAYLSEHLSSFRNDKHRAQWKSSLDRANKSFGDINVASVDIDVLVKFIQPIWEATPESGSRIRGRVEKVLDWATARKFRRGENPARWRGHMEHLLKARPKGKHHAALPFSEIPGFMQELRERDSISARALEFAILTAGRTGEVIGARWEEINFSTKVWTVPEERMKAGRQHEVPLSSRAVEILEAMPRAGEFVFPSSIAGQPISNMAMLELLKGMNGRGLTVHGFRSSFRDWAGDRTNYARDVIEHALAHRIKDKAEASYRRTSALEKRRRLMEEWARYCASPVIHSNVVSIGSAS
jgi:integrase